MNLLFNHFSHKNVKYCFFPDNLSEQLFDFFVIMIAIIESLGCTVVSTKECQFEDVTLGSKKI